MLKLFLFTNFVHAKLSDKNKFIPQHTHECKAATSAITETEKNRYCEQINTVPMDFSPRNSHPLAELRHHMAKAIKMCNSGTV